MNLNQLLLLSLILIGTIFGQNYPAIKIAAHAQAPCISTSLDGRVFIGWVQTDSSFSGQSGYSAWFDSAHKRILQPSCIANYCTSSPTLLLGDTAVLALWASSILEIYPYGQFLSDNGSASGGRFSFSQGSQPVGFYSNDTSYSIAWKGYTSGILATKYHREQWAKYDTLLTGSSANIGRILYLPGKNSKILIWNGKTQTQFLTYIQKFSTSNQPLGDRITLNSDTTVTGMYGFSAAVMPDSSLAIVWSGKKNNLWRIFRNILYANNVLSPTETVTSEDVDVCAQAEVSVAYNANGESVIAFEGQKISYLQRFNADGTAIDSTIPLIMEDGTTFYPAVSLWRNKIHAAWTENTTAGNTVWYQVFDFNNPFNAIDNQQKKDNLKQFTLAQNYPNPFNPATTIQYTLPVYGAVNVVVYNVLGKKVATLVNEIKSPGTYSVNFNATDLPSGIYFYNIVSGGFSATRKMILLK